MINDNYEFYFEEYGSPEKLETVAPAAVTALAANMPPQYGQLLEQYGEFSQRGHMFKLVRTDRLRSLGELIFEGDQDFGDGNLNIFCFSIFGSLYFWHTEHGLGFVDLVTGAVRCFNLTNPDKAPASEHFFASFDIPFSMENESFDVFDDADKPLFKRAFKKLGAPELMECYGFVPALAFGGEAKLQNLQKLSAPEHFAILAQATEFTLTKSDNYGEVTEVRVIGR